LENTHKLKVLGFQRQDSAARGALEKSASVDAESALLREIEQRARTKRGLDD
jgi:hypothetical protein